MDDLETLTARTALDPLDIVIGGPSDAGVTLTEIPYQTRLMLRGLPTDKRFTAAVKKATADVTTAAKKATASAK